MDRSIVYLGQVPYDTDVLLTNLHPYISIAKLAAALLGTSTVLNGLSCTQNGTPNMTVNVGSGEIYQNLAIDVNPYGSLPTNSNQILKQGINLTTTNVTGFTAPATSGQSVNYLIEFTLSEADGGSQILYYYNSTNPAESFTGPQNDNLPNYTVRQDRVGIQIKAGTPATTGTQTTPSPDSGYVGGYVVTIAHGATTIVNGNISVYPGAPFLPGAATNFATAAGVQEALYSYAADTSVSANTITASVSPVPSAYTTGMVVYIKVANSNTGASTINLNSLGAINIKYTNGNALVGGELIASGLYAFEYDGTNFQILNPTITLPNIQNTSYNYAADSSGSANTITASLSPVPASYTTGMVVFIKVAHSNTGASTININSLGSKNIKYTNGNALIGGEMIANGLYAFEYDGTNFQILNPLFSASAYATITNVQDFAYNYAAGSGTNTITATLSPAPASYTTGMVVFIKAANTTTTSATLNLNSLGAVTIHYTNGTSLVGGEIVANGLYAFEYDGTYFQLLNPYLTLPLSLANGGTNANLTASNGGIFYSTASAGAILSGTATAGLALLSGASTTPSWSTNPPITKVNVQSITSTGSYTYTPTTGTKFAIFEIQGGGAGSGGTGGSGGSASAAGAGGGGGYMKILVSGTANLAAVSGSIGTGGSAGANGAGNNGGAGNNTTLIVNSGSTWTAGGGSGGSGSAGASSSAGNGSGGGAGGTNTSGTNGTLLVSILGQAGSSGFFSAGGSPPALGGFGGSSQLGRGGGFNTAGGNYGGGAGSLSNITGSNAGGAAGAQGIVVVTEYISI